MVSRTTSAKRYRVNAQMSVASSVEISAASLDDALAKAKEMKITDFIEFIGENEDNNFAISGVSKADWIPDIK